MGFWSRFFRDRLAVAGLVIVLSFFALSILTPVIAPYDPSAIDVNSILMPPSARHLFGTDDLGRDVFTRMLYGAGISLKVGFVAVGIATIIGVLLGSIAGYYGGVIDLIIMRFVDIMLCFPSFFLILAVIAFLEPSIFNIMAVIGLTSWMGITRLVRAEFLSLKERDFVLAAKTMGAKSPRIIFLHILPNAMAPVLVAATLGIASAVLVESAL
ncbi:MAG TPA: ABC transporter permease, partial [Deltaproteobacteria bacterium]|nr:ABC transporter permease [Deltaproteobacteria bacterium]